MIPQKEKKYTTCTIEGWLPMYFIVKQLKFIQKKIRICNIELLWNLVIPDVMAI